MNTLAKGLAKARLRSIPGPAPAPASAPPREPTGDAEVPLEPLILDAGEDRGLDIDSLPYVAPDPKVAVDNRIVFDEQTAASSAYKMLRTRILQRMRSNNWKTIAVSGTCPNEGKSLTAINLSISLARDVGTSVVLADFDFRKPSLHDHLGISTRYGIGDFLRGAVALEETAVRPGIERLAVLLNERCYASSSEMLTSPQTANLVRRLKQGEGRIVVFDLPPMLASDDLLAFCPLVDAVLLVVSQGTTKRTDIDVARDLLQNVNVVGVVLNRASEQTAPYYYGAYGGVKR